MRADEVVRFWFDEIPRSQWWEKDDAFDQEIASRFASVHQQAVQGELFSWRETARGRLAEVIVLDQFSRNMFRGLAKSFASDGVALVLSQEAIRCGADRHLTDDQRGVLYLPFMHSESPLVHRQAVDLFSSLGAASSLDFELKHKAIIDRFSRYPHRNSILGRVSTDEEIAFLNEPGSSF